MPKWFIGLSILSAILLGGLLGSSSANAVSPSDNVVRVVDELILDYGTGTENISTNWLQQTEQALRDRGKNTDADNMMSTIGDPGNSWAVIQNGNNEIYVIWSTGKTTEFSFYLDDYLVSNGQICQTRAMTWSVVTEKLTHPSTSVQCYNSSNTVWFGNNAAAPGIFILNYPMTYPTGYEGVEIPDSYGEEHAYNAGTGLIPVSDYTVDDLEIKIKDITSAAEKILYKVDECMFQLPNNSYGDNFTEYMYDCNNPTEITHTFADGYAGYNIIHRLHSTETDLWYESTLVLDVDGSEFSGSIGKIDLDIYAKCVNDDAPYLHFEDCLRAFGKITNSMSFGAIDLLGAFRYEPTSECRELGTLGDWLGLNNKEICPQFSSEVRSVVTPFMSFGISIGVLGAILTKSRTDFM